MDAPRTLPGGYRRFSRGRLLRLCETGTRGLDVDDMESTNSLIRTLAGWKEGVVEPEGEGAPTPEDLLALAALAEQAALQTGAEKAAEPAGPKVKPKTKKPFFRDGSSADDENEPPTRKAKKESGRETRHDPLEKHVARLINVDIENLTCERPYSLERKTIWKEPFIWPLCMIGMESQLIIGKYGEWGPFVAAFHQQLQAEFPGANQTSLGRVTDLLISVGHVILLQNKSCESPLLYFRPLMPMLEEARILMARFEGDRISARTGIAKAGSNYVLERLSFRESDFPLGASLKTCRTSLSGKIQSEAQAPNTASSTSNHSKQPGKNRREQRCRLCRMKVAPGGFPAHNVKGVCPKFVKERRDLLSSTQQDSNC